MDTADEIQRFRGNSLYFWLPCNRANFAHHSDRQLLRRMEGERLSLSILLGERFEFGLSSSVVRRTVGIIGGRTSDGWAQYYPGSAANSPYVEIDFWHPEVGQRVRLRLSTAGLNWFRSETASDDELRKIARDLIEMPTPFDPNRGEDHFIDDDPDSEDNYQGYLSFFQINILLGVLFNPSLEPGIFLEAGDGKEEVVNLWDGVLESFALSSSTRGDETVEPVALLSAALSEFVAVTTDATLLPLKWRLERARRALLGFVMGLVHRKSRLVQVRQRLEYPESFDDGNETQLRGYVMLVSGKLPLLINVEEHLNTTIRAVTREAKGKEGVAAARGLDPQAGEEDDSVAEDLIGAWIYAVQAIRDNVEGLERAVEHAWMERTLYEQAQMRAEQEALAEIERARSRSNAFSSTIDSPVFMITLVVATAALVVTVADWPAGFRLLGGGVAGLLLLILIEGGARMHRGWKVRRGEQNRHYYEYNLTFNVELAEEQIKRLMSESLELRSRAEEEKRLELFGPSPLQIERHGSVRVERIADEEVIYKVHLEARIELLPKRLLARILPPGLVEDRAVEVFAIYEIFYHRPTKNAEFLLRDVRTTAIAPAALEPEQLDELTELVMAELVIPLVPEAGDHIASGEEPTMAMFDIVDRRERPRLAVIPPG